MEIVETVLSNMGDRVAQLVEPQTHEVKIPSSILAASGGPALNIRQSYISEVVIVGYTVYTHP